MRSYEQPKRLNAPVVGMMDEHRKAIVDVFGWSEDGGSTPRPYSVPLEVGMNVLNALEYIHAHLDPSVSFRSSCRRGVCGGCLMMIDGKLRLACETEVRDGMTINPYHEE